MDKITFNIGDKVKANSNTPLKGNSVAPELVIGKEYTVLHIIFDSEKNQHLDVGLASNVSYVRSYETGEELPDGHRIHWCHPSRFEKV